MILIALCAFAPLANVIYPQAAIVNLPESARKLNTIHLFDIYCISYFELATLNSQAGVWKQFIPFLRLSPFYLDP